MHISNYRPRAKAVFLIFFLLLALSGLRLIFIQLLRSSYLSAIAQKQHNLFVELQPLRGTIFDSNLRAQAINIAADSLYASPNEINHKDKESIIRELSGILNLGYAYLKDRFYRKKSFIWIARKITPEQAAEIKKLNIKGLGFVKESRRSYPNGYLASHILGFAGIDNIGLDGLELYYDNYLKGEPGWAFYLRDARQNNLGLLNRMALPKDGLDIVLTIDEVVQYIAEQELEKAFDKYHAKGASIVVMDPHTGEILALANRPTYNPDDFGSSPKDSMRDRAITDLFEPGSVFKIVTMSAALEEGKVSEEDKFFCENGSYRVASHILHDHQPHGWLTFRQVIEESSNIGTTKVAQALGPEIIYKYISLFGFGVKSGLDMPGEISGVNKPPRAWSKVSIGAIPIGQEIGVTALQLASAISVIANGGQLMKPYILKEVRTKDGDVLKRSSPVLVRKVISVDTAARGKKILTGVIEEGTGKLAKIDGITAAGKTGTAQKLEPSGVYSHDKFVASFIGFAPVEDPMVVIAVCVDEPHPYYFGGVVSAPVFKNVASQTIKYLRTRRHSRELVLLNENNRAYKGSR